MYCMHCGKNISDSSRFCKFCGKLVAEDEIISFNDDDNMTDFEENAEVVTEDIYTDDYIITDDNIKDEEIIIDDLFFEHMSKKRKIALFFSAVFMTAIVAAIVFAVCFPELL